MLIDTFAEHWFAELRAHEESKRPSHGLFLLVDGVFVPGLQRGVREDAKKILFESLPSCTEQVADVSPFLIRFASPNATVTALLRHCNRWPMVSAIETPESLSELSDRLAGWCVVEAEGQRFNFRFPDTRRLPTIYRTLTPAQRAQMAGPCVRWSYISRTGQWCELPVHCSSVAIAHDPVLDSKQFAALVDDSRTDELLTLLSDRGIEVYAHPSRSYELVNIAVRAAVGAQLSSGSTLDWCEWFWHEDNLTDHATATLQLTSWQGHCAKERNE